MIDRREFSRLMAVGALGTGLGSSVWAQGNAPVNGTHYLTLDKPVATEPKGKVEVLEFFWYNCPHCNRFEPALDAWLARWQARADADALPAAQRAQAMRRVSPRIIPRNHRVEEALDAASSTGDLRPFEALLQAIRRPYDDDPALDRYAEPAPAGYTDGYRTFCGT